MRQIALIIFLLSSVTYQVFAQNQDSVEGDRQALIDLYEATNGDSWENNSGWLNGNPSNSWHGIEVDSNNRVIRIDLFNNNLVGVLPESIGNLLELKYLNLKQNSLSGHIPESIGNLNKVEWLLLAGIPNPKEPRVERSTHPGKSDASGNDFSGTIPRTIGEMKSLMYLEISGTSISGSLPEEIGDLSNLKGIHVNWNRNMNGEIPRSLSKLSQLRQFYMSRNALTGTIPDVSALTELLQFHVGNGDNNLIGEIPDFSNSTKLKELNLDANDLSGEWGHYWNNGNFTQLISLRAEWNSGITGTLHGFDNLTGLRTLSLTGTGISGTIPESITALNSVIIISFGWTNLEGELPQNWNSLDNLRTLRLNANKLTGNIPADLVNKAQNSRLQSLRFGDNNFSSFDSENLNNISFTSDGLEIHGNNLTFKDIKPVLEVLSTNAFSYNNQGPFGADMNLSRPTDQKVVLSFDIDHPGNEYQWYKDGQAIGGATSHSYTINSMSTTDEGEYTLRVSNSSIPSLGTLESRTITLKVGEEDGDGDSGDDSAGSGSDPLTSPDIISPKDGATSVSLTPMLQWENLNVDYYELNLKDPTEEYPIVDADVDGNSYSVNSSEQLKPDTVYKWRVRGVKDGVEGEWSTIAEFTTQADDGGNGNNGNGPQKSTPAKGDDKVSKKPTFKWNKVEEAETYDLEVMDAETQELLVDEIVADTSYTPGKEFQPNHKYQWRVRGITTNGELGEWGDTWEFMTAEELSFEVEVDQNYPNPFNPSTNIRFTLTEQQEISLKVYDMTGRLVATLINSEMLGGGPHSARFDAGNLASGIYFYRIITPGEIVTRKMTLMK